MKVLALAFSWHVASIEAYAEKPSLELAAGPALLVGYAEELVYRDESTSELLSRLRWQLMPAAGLRLDAALSPFPQAPIAIEASFLALIPAPSGTMVDEDWNAGSLVYGRSEHEAQLSRGVFATLSLALKGSIAKGTGWLGLGISWMDVSWEAWGGSYSYDYGAAPVEGSLSGLVISYRLMRVAPSLSLGLQYEKDGTATILDLAIEPFGLGWGIDSHVARGDGISSDMTYIDRLRNGIGIKPRARIAFPLGSLRTSIGLAYLGLFGARGYSSGTDKDGITSYYGNIGGAMFSALEISLKLELQPDEARP